MAKQIENYTHLPGKNCITTAIRSILNFYGYRYREAMVFGLAEGLGFSFQVIDDLQGPHLSGVGRGLLDSFCRNLRLPYDVTEFDSDEAAMKDLKDHISDQIPVVVQVDLFHLPYFESKTHFAGHRVVPVGYDDENFYLSDTGYVSLQVCPIDKFVEARRSAFPPFKPNRRRVRIERISERPFLEETVTKALYNVYAKFERGDPGYNLEQIFDLRANLSVYKNTTLLHQQIEKAGTGGGLSRKLFAEFLDQSAQIYGRTIYELASALYEQSAALWREIAVRAKAGSFDGISERLEKIYEVEKRAISVFSSYEAEDL